MKTSSLMQVLSLSLAYASNMSCNSFCDRKIELAVKQTEEDKWSGNTLDAGSGQRKVTELLLEQVECADIVLINKCDLLKGEDEIKLVEKVKTVILHRNKFYYRSFER